MSFLTIVTIPITLLVLTFRLSKFATKLLLNTARTLSGKAEKSNSKIRAITLKTTRFVKSSARTVASATKLAVKVSYYTIRLIIFVLRAIITFIISTGVLGLVVAIVLIVSVIAAYVVIISYDNKDDYSKLASNNKYAYINGSDLSSYGGIGSISTLAQIDQGTLDFIMESSNHKPDVVTKVCRSDFTSLANLLMSGENTVANSAGKKTSKYLGYMFGGYHYLNCETDVQKYMDILPSRPNLAQLKAISTDLDNTKYRAGIKYKENKTIFVDCSGFVAWYYATVFSAVDKENKDFKTLANWFYGCSTASDFKGTYNCKEVSFNNLKPGDIIVRRQSSSTGGTSGHVGIIISKEEYIHASTERVGVLKDKITNGSFADSSGFRRDVEVKAYRPKIKFADD